MKLADTATPQEVIQALRIVNDQFYWMCFRAGVGAHAHAFLEFNGLMAKYVTVMARAVENGVNPYELNEHNGIPLPVETHDMEYLGEKLRCIFGPTIDANPEAAAALKRALFGET